VGRESVRLRRLHDTSVDGDSVAWDLGAALAFLDGLLDAPPHARPEPRRPKREHVPGEGSAGDLGRLWMARSGRSDDLVWTRHAFESGESHHHLDVAVERRALLEELERARERGAATEPQVVRAASEWSAAHAPLATDGWEIAELRAFLAPLGDDAILALCAAVPTRAAALSPAERTPLVALSRRRADIDAKSLAALALLSDAADAAVLVGDDGVFVRAHGRIVDLSGPLPRERTNVRAEEALRRAPA
jgi:PAS domain-containing protein